MSCRVASSNSWDRTSSADRRKLPNFSLVLWRSSVTLKTAKVKHVKLFIARLIFSIRKHWCPSEVIQPSDEITSTSDTKLSHFVVSMSGLEHVVKLQIGREVIKAAHGCGFACWSCACVVRCSACEKQRRIPGFRSQQ